MLLHKKIQWIAAGLLFCAALTVIPAHAQQGVNKEEISRLKDEINRLKRQREKELEQIEANERLERQKTISNYESFLAKYQDSPKRADIMFQLARAYFEEEEATYMSAMKKYEVALAEFATKGGTKPTEPKKDYDRTIRIYTQLDEEFPNFDMMDAVLYTLGYCYKEMKQFEEMFITYTQLAERFPKAKYAFEAHFHIGEYLFEQHEYLQAIEHYERVINAPTRVNFEKAIYKLGWSYYKLSDYMNAVNKFVSLVDKAGVDSDLREEAVTYIAISFSEFGGIDRAFEYFESIGGRTYVDEVAHKLGDIFRKTDKLEEAIDAFDKFLNRYPTYRRAPEVMLGMVECLRIMKQYDKANSLREDLIDRYRQGGDWYRQNTDSGIREKAVEIVEKALFENVAFYFLEADRRGQKDLYGKAVERSRKYLSMFPSHKNAYELNYWLAECLYKLERFDEAVPEYKKIAANKEETKYGEVAAYNVVKCFEQIDEKNKGQKGLTSSKKNLLTAINEFEGLYPESKFAVELVYKKGGIYFALEDYAKARETYTRIYEQYPDDHLGVLSARMVAISYNKQKDFTQAEAWFVKVSQHPRANKKELAEAQRMVAASIYEQAAVLRKEKKNLEAAVIFKRVAADHPESEFADKALSDAGACYEDEKQWDAAAAIYQEIAEKYPQSKLAIAALGRAAVCYEKNNDPNAAISAYELIPVKYPNAKEAPGALYSAGLLSEKSENWQRAVDNYSLLSTKYPSSEYTADAVFSIALSYEKLGDLEMAVSYFKRFGDKFTAKKPEMGLDALIRAGEGYFKAGNTAESKKLLDKALGTYERLMEDGKQINAELPAKAHFYLGEIAYQDFDAIEFKQPRKAMKRAQNKKGTMLREAQEHYAEAIRSAIVEWTTRGTYKIGLAFEEFGDTWHQQELPKKDKRGRRIKQDQKIVLQIKIREQVPQFYNQAHTFYKSNIKFGREQSLTDNEWVVRSQERATLMLQKIGGMYEEIALIFREAPVPAELSQEEKEMYIGALQEQALQKEDIAVEVYKNALNWIIEEKLDNQYTEAIKDRLNELAPGVVDQIIAGTVKEEEKPAKDLDALVKAEGTQKLDDIIDETEKAADWDKWTPDECRTHEENIRPRIQEQEEVISGLKAELENLNQQIADVKAEMESLQN